MGLRKWNAALMRSGLLKSSDRFGFYPHPPSTSSLGKFLLLDDGALQEAGSALVIDSLSSWCRIRKLNPHCCYHYLWILRDGLFCHYDDLTRTGRLEWRTQPNKSSAVLQESAKPLPAHTLASSDSKNRQTAVVVAATAATAAKGSATGAAASSALKSGRDHLVVRAPMPPVNHRPTRRRPNRIAEQVADAKEAHDSAVESPVARRSPDTQSKGNHETEEAGPVAHQPPSSKSRRRSSSILTTTAAAASASTSNSMSSILSLPTATASYKTPAVSLPAPVVTPSDEGSSRPSTGRRKRGHEADTGPALASGAIVSEEQADTGRRAAAATTATNVAAVRVSAQPAHLTVNQYCLLVQRWATLDPVAVRAALSLREQGQDGSVLRLVEILTAEDRADTSPSDSMVRIVLDSNSN